MITAWILYAVVVGALLGGSGLALERCLRTQGLPSRWVWVGAILLSLGWPIGQWVWENRSEAVPAFVESGASAVPAPSPSLMVFPMEAITVEVPPASILRRLDRPILVAWGLATSLLLLFFTFLLFRTHRLRAQWREGEAGGRPVLYSDDWGPAVVGVLRPQIVLPVWCERLDGRAIRFILDHELEHLRAGDLRVVLLTGLFPILFPWHLPLWWQLARLRTAVESDCDQRVLEKNPGQTRSYVDLLLEVGERTSRYRPLAAMLSEPYDTLKRRIRIMTMPLPKRPWLRGGLLTGAGTILVALACWAPEPMDVRDEGGEAAVEPEATLAGGAANEGRSLPVFTPYSVRPSLRNPDEVMTTLAREYPKELTEAGIGGTATLWLFLDETGKVLRVMVTESSGHQDLDNTAIRAAGIAEFTSALNRDQARPVWISLPIEFTASGKPAVGEGGPAGEPVEGSVWTVPSPPPARVSDEEGRVTGTVTDASTGQPLPFAQVFVAGTGRGTLTDREGRFSIDHVPTGDQEVVVQLIGFGEGRTIAELLVAGQAPVDFALEPAAIGMNKLVVVVGGAGGS